MIKAVFFDIDGTLVSFDTHKISDSSKEAIKILKEKGIKVFIASGRALFQIDNLDGLDFDGYITINGGSCLVKDNGDYKEIYRVSLDKADLFALVDYLNKDKFPCTVITSDNLFINYTGDIIAHLYGMANVRVPESRDFNDIKKNI